ncbi:phosphatase 2C-containing protein [Tribonema minus]|uniref:Phosphatase 2C-containing protein n=1 Tax=Tribonema minus TaxID=303371 RepID=A0A835YTT3_9STRA|nr:phosphatase 2C-containing protein [Tribonema minus]
MAGAPAAAARERGGVLRPPPHHHILHDPRRDPVTVAQTCAGGRAGVCSIQGLKPGNPRWENQDNFVMEEALDIDGGGDRLRVFAVLDGHGEAGHLVTRRCRERLPQLLRAARGDAARACVALHEDLASGVHVDCQCSGATCVVVTISARGAVTVANLGDSRCVLGRWECGGGGGRSGGGGGGMVGRAQRQVCAVPLTTDHKPDRPDERARIQAAGGQVGSRQLIVGSGPAGPIRIPMGPARVWYQVRGETMGLAMSRSIGDVIAHAAGVSAQPEVVEHCLDRDAGDAFLVLASDGVWDVLDAQAAVHIVAACAAAAGGAEWDPREAAALLAAAARKRWDGLSPMIDDITALVVKL